MANIMDMCRVCLDTEENQLIPLDETFIDNYNILTNLNVELCDRLPQQTCQSCLNKVMLFVEFRENSISSETTLKKLIYENVTSEVKHEINDSEEVSELKEEINEQDNISKQIKEEAVDDHIDLWDQCNEFDYSINPDIVEPVKKSKNLKSERKKLKQKGKDLKDFFKEEYLKEQFFVVDGETLPSLKNIKTERRIGAKSFKKTNEEIVEDLLLCGLCKYSSRNNVELNKHLARHEKERTCGICEETVKSWAELLGHRLIHIPVKQKRCHLCHKRFVTHTYLEFHYKNTHFGEEAKLACKYCNKQYYTPKKLCKHIWAAHSDKKYVCDYCSKTIYGKPKLRSHIHSHLQNKAFVCDTCGLSFNYIGGLKDHTIRRHTAQKVLCKICQRPFESQESHDKHKCGVKFVICPTCGKSYNRSKISRHLSTHANGSNYKCDRCPATFKSKSGFREHMNRHEGNKTKQCEFCSATFYCASTLIKHRRIHTGERPYVCKICGKGFTANHNRKIHMKVHGENLVNKTERKVFQLIK